MFHHKKWLTSCINILDLSICIYLKYFCCHKFYKTPTVGTQNTDALNPQFLWYIAILLTRISIVHSHCYTTRTITETEKNKTALPTRSECTDVWVCQCERVCMCLISCFHQYMHPHMCTSEVVLSSIVVPMHSIAKA